MPRIINNGKEIEFNDGTRMPLQKGIPMHCPKCGSRIGQADKSAGCLILWIVLLLIIGMVWFLLTRT